MKLAVDFENLIALDSVWDMLVGFQSIYPIPPLDLDFLLLGIWLIKVIWNSEYVEDVNHKVAYNNKTLELVELPTAEKELKYGSANMHDN